MPIIPVYILKHTFGKFDPKTLISKWTQTAVSTASAGVKDSVGDLFVKFCILDSELWIKLSTIGYPWAIYSVCDYRI